jgi:transcription elongation factor SPT6
MAPLPETGRPPSHPARACRPGQLLLAALLDISLTRFQVGLSTRPEDLREPRRPRVADFDPYYDHDAARGRATSQRRGFPEPHTDADTNPDADADADTNTNTDPDPDPDAQHHAPKHTKPRRLISHPSYKDVSRGEAERLLGPAQLGEVIVRPSASRGPDHLALTWKLDQCTQGGLYLHLDIHEADRPADNPYGLGRPLRVALPTEHGSGSGSATSTQTLVYEDLDEIIARLVEPTAAFLQDVRACPKFLPVDTLDRTAARAHVEAFLAAERHKAPGRIAYCLSLSRDTPGAVLLSYQPASRCHHEIIGVSPAGFRLRGTTFDRLDALINWFKQNHSRR